MTEPRELTYLVPVDVLAEVNNAVAALETHGPVVTEALRQLDRATTLDLPGQGPPTDVTSDGP